MIDKDMYNQVLEFTKFDVSDPDGITRERAKELVMEGWRQPVNLIYNILEPLNVKATRLFYDKGILNLEWEGEDPDIHKAMVFILKHIKKKTFSRCLYTGGMGRPQQYIEQRPPLSWKYAAIFANTHFEEHGYDGLYEPDPEAEQYEHKYNLRGRYRGGSPARKFHSWTTGKDDPPSGGESSECDSSDEGTR